MLNDPVLIRPGSDFWLQAAHALAHAYGHNFAGLSVIVPTFLHAQQLKQALARQQPGAFMLPQITTLSAWLDLSLPPAASISDSERLMALYAELRQHGWLKKLFTARRNADLLPLAQILLTLSDELTQALLPALRLAPEALAQRWQTALGQLSPAAHGMVSDEAHLVWSIWRGQLDGADKIASDFIHMLHCAAQAKHALAWIAPNPPDALEQAFLQAYAKQQPVLPIMLDWRAAAVPAIYLQAWPELLEANPGAAIDADAQNRLPSVAPLLPSLYPARTLEDEALHGAQTVIDWLQAGKSVIAIIAQDRIVARRIRALLERAQVMVADETGWKLATTRAAAALAAWFEVVAGRAETVSLMDLLKSPFVQPIAGDKVEQLMPLEMALRRSNVLGGWDAVHAALADLPQQRAWLSTLAAQAGLFAGRKNLLQWVALTKKTLNTLGMHATFIQDAAGQQVNDLLLRLEQDCNGLQSTFSFPEWHAFIGLQLEAVPFVAPQLDRRVVMLPLNGARLRWFDAVLLVGADADHLPSQPQETLFFANAVRRELGLATRESRQSQQLRDLTELLMNNREVVLSWQAHQGDEPNPLSPWFMRLQLALALNGNAALPLHRAAIDLQKITPLPSHMPAPNAPQLLPQKLSASGYTSLVACPYQFFATRMLRLSVLDELSDMPQKRDYGDWLHRILKIYHETLRDQQIEISGRENLLREVSKKIFDIELARNAAALGYYARWQKAIPAYLAWANQRESQGWHFSVGEQYRENPLSWPGGSVLLHGRIDRIDVDDNGQHAILDYKTKNASALREKLRQQDHQLAFYGLLLDEPVSLAHFVALEPSSGNIMDVEAPQYTEWQLALHAQIAADMAAIGQGAALPATGVEAVCMYCDMRGLCRKGSWQ